LVDGRPAVLVRDPGDPSKMLAHFVLLDWQATVSSVSEIFVSHIQACHVA
jgi:hypothetical protein